MTTEEAIVLLRRKRQELANKQKTTPVSDLFNKLNLSLVNFIADIAIIFANKTAKAEVTNEVTVKVSNFPNQPVLDTTTIVNAIKSIPEAKQVDFTPVVRAIQKLPAPQQLDLQPVIDSIRSLPKPTTPPDAVSIKNQIDLSVVESLLSQLLKVSDKSKEDKHGKDKEMFHKQLIEEIQKQFAILTEAVSENAAPSAVKVLNTSDFPVATSIATYKKSDGTIGYGLVDDNGNVQVEVNSSVLPTGAATSANQTNGNQITQIKETAPTDATKNNPSYTVTKTFASPVLTTVIQKVISGTTYTKTIVKNTSTGVETITAWS